MQQQEGPRLCPAADAVVVVLDTNVVLDWLVFRDPGFAPLAAQLDGGAWAWHATAAMRAELADVLPRLTWRGSAIVCEHTLTKFDRKAVIVGAAPLPPGADARRACRDPDDQKFLDLACQLPARWLFSRDQAVLERARDLRPWGVEVLSPAQWRRQHPT